MAKKQEWTATGRRKRSVARVRLVGGTGNITVNGVDVNDYMPYATLVMDLKQPLVATGNENRFDIDINVKGGGFSGQTGSSRGDCAFVRSHGMRPFAAGHCRCDF